MKSQFFTTLLRWLSALALVAFLSGCFYPEKFTLDADFHEDGSVDLTYDGVIFAQDAVARMRATKKPLNEHEDSTMLKVGDVLAKRPEFKSVKYLGNGRYQIKATRSARGDQLLVDMPIFGVFRDLENNTDVVMQTGTAAEPMYRGLGVNPEGVIRITVPDNAKVISSSTEPSRSMLLFGKRTFTWNYKLGSEAKMRLRF